MKQILSFFIILFACAACRDVQQTGMETFTLSDTFSTLFVKTTGGSITVLSGNGSDAGADIIVSVEKTARGFNEKHARRLLEGITVVSRQEDGIQKIAVMVS